jgi:hypothetical protein
LATSSTMSAARLVFAVADRKMWAEMNMSPTDLATSVRIPTPIS